MLKIRLVPALVGLLYAAPLAYVAAALAQSSSLQGDVDRGAEQFETVCAECHGASETAPTLRGVIGREVASVASYTGYSEALKSKKPMKWTVENLDNYLKSPEQFVPGSLMYRDFPDPQLRADVIAFLATLPPPR